MAVSVVAYGWLFGFTFAIGFVALLLLHEIGHVIQLRREGIKACAPIFIPFLGAVIAAKSLGKDAAAEARVGLAGPVLGSMATLVPLGIWLATGNDFWRALAYLGFFLNLFNLMPVVPLDGGRAMAALNPAVWMLGLAGLLALVIFYPSPILFLILIFGGWRAGGDGRLARRQRPGLLRDPRPHPSAGRRRLPGPSRRAIGWSRRDLHVAQPLDQRAWGNAERSTPAAGGCLRRRIGHAGRRVLVGSRWRSFPPCLTPTRDRSRLHKPGCFSGSRSLARFLTASVLIQRRRDPERWRSAPGAGFD